MIEDVENALMLRRRLTGSNRFMRIPGPGFERFLKRVAAGEVKKVRAVDWSTPPAPTSKSEATEARRRAIEILRLGAPK